MTDIVRLLADVAAALASIIAVCIAVAAWRLASRTFRRDHRPLVRVVATWPAGHDLPEPMAMDAVILKNIGRGPGVTVIAFDPIRRALTGDVEVAEPLGSGTDERNRTGRAVMALRSPMLMDSTYELYYQDILGAWHLTRFRPVPWRIECSFVGEVRNRELPAEVKTLGTVARP